MAAEKPPTPRPSSDIASSGPARLPRAVANSRYAASTTVVAALSSAGAVIRLSRCGLTRPASRTPSGSGSTVAALPAATTPRVPGTTARRRVPVPSRPRTGAATAPVSSAIVRVHWAAARETPSVVATLVISGAPRLPTTATTSAISSSVLVSARAWRSSGAGSPPFTG